jgi:hypothetical protein
MAPPTIQRNTVTRQQVQPNQTHCNPPAAGVSTQRQHTTLKRGESRAEKIVDSPHEFHFEIKLLQVPVNPYRSSQENQNRRGIPLFPETAAEPLGKFLSSGKSLSGSAVLIGHQQQATDDRQVLEQLNPLHGVSHIAVKDHRRGHQEQQQQDRPQPCLPATDHQG